MPKNQIQFFLIYIKKHLTSDENANKKLWCAGRGTDAVLDAGLMRCLNT